MTTNQLISEPDYATLLGAEAHAFSTTEHGAFINGERRPGGGDTIERIDPSTGAAFGRASEADDATVDEAVRGAHHAFRGEWGRMLPAERETVLRRLGDLILEHGRELAEYDALEGGKPVSQVAAVDVPLAAEQFHYFAGWPTKITGSVVSTSVPDRHVFTRRTPLGVIAAVTPWNFPLCQAAIKAAPALAAGNAVVLKPSELTSLSSLRLAELAIEAGMPPGTLNVVNGRGATTGAALTSHPLVAKISFTGSSAVGRVLGAQAGGRLQHASLELGGKNPHIIFADADIETAAAYAATTAYFYSGQVCFSGSRLFVERGIENDVIDAIKAQASNLVIGHGLHDATTMGPLSSETHLAKVAAFLQESGPSGGSIAFGGNRIEAGGGYYLEPTAIVNPADTDTRVQDEIFGPVLVVQSFDSADEVVERANGVEYGLAAGLWTRDLGRALTVSQQLEAGTVWVNTYGDFNAAAAFGGVKASGLGRDCGPEALDKYLETKTVWMAQN